LKKKGGTTKRKGGKWEKIRVKTRRKEGWELGERKGGNWEKRKVGHWERRKGGTGRKEG